MSGETPEFRLKSREPTVRQGQLPPDIHSLPLSVCPNPVSFTLLQWAWLQEYVTVTEIKWNDTDYKEKNPTVEGIPYLLNMDEYLLELEDSFSEKKVLGISTCQVLGTDKGFIDFWVNIKIKHLRLYSLVQFDSSSY